MRKLSRSRFASSSIGKSLVHLVAEDGHAARLEPDERDPGLDLGPERVEDLRAAAAWPCRACRSRRAAGRSRATASGTITWNPASSSTSTAAFSVCGWKWLLNVSAQSMTGGKPTFRGGRRLHQSLNVSVANAGILRCVEMPPITWNSLPRPGASSSALTTPGIHEASRAHQ